MAFFKLRRSQNDSRPKASTQPPSIEAIRQRAKYRLAGATLLVLVAIIGLPLLFDKQPRPIAVDAPIVIPNKDKLAPLNIPVIPDKPASAASSSTATTAPPAASAALAAPAASHQQDTKPETLAKHRKSTVPDIKEKPGKSKGMPTKTKNTPADKRQPEANRVLALLEDRADATDTNSVTKASKSNRFVIQVGAFSDDAYAREVRAKLERAGLKTYTQISQTKDGRRIRVRVGPFTSQEQANQVVAKIKQLQLPAALLTP